MNEADAFGHNVGPKMAHSPVNKPAGGPRPNLLKSQPKQASKKANIKGHKYGNQGMNAEPPQNFDQQYNQSMGKSN